MSANLAAHEVDAAQVSSVAKALARRHNLDGKGRAVQHCVRLTSTVEELLTAAKPEGQSMPEYLREAGLTVALQRLEDSQN